MFDKNEPTQQKPITRVLMVEDDLCLKSIMIRTMQKIDPKAKVDWVVTAEKGMNMITERVLADERYDLIVADIGLPGEKSGLDLWQYCKAVCPETSFVFSSGMPVDRFLTILRDEMICPPLLSKPFSTGECQQVLTALLDYRNGTPPGVQETS
jgi:response regulator of citrate/malate metabolism